MIPIWMLTYLATWKLGRKGVKVKRCEGLQALWIESIGIVDGGRGEHLKPPNLHCRQGGRTSNPASRGGAHRCYGNHGNHGSHGTKGDWALGGLGIYWVPLTSPRVIFDGIMIMEGISCGGYVISFMRLSLKIEQNWWVQTFWQLSDVVKRKSCEFGYV